MPLLQPISALLGLDDDDDLTLLARLFTLLWRADTLVQAGSSKPSTTPPLRCLLSAVAPSACPMLIAALRVARRGTQPRRAALCVCVCLPHLATTHVGDAPRPVQQPVPMPTLQDRGDLIDQLDKRPDAMWRTGTLWSFRNEAKVYGSPMLDAVWCELSRGTGGGDPLPGVLSELRGAAVPPRLQVPMVGAVQQFIVSLCESSMCQLVPLITII